MWPCWFLLVGSLQFEQQSRTAKSSWNAYAYFFGEGPRSRCYGRTAALRLIVQPCDEDKDDQYFHFSKSWSTGGMKLTGENRSTRWKTCPSATLSTTNPTWTDPGSKPGLRGGRQATNRLSHGTALRMLKEVVDSSAFDRNVSNYSLQTTSAFFLNLIANRKRFVVLFQIR
jgi:hypothetical protein